MKKDYRNSLEVAFKGAKYKSDLLPAFYLQIGNNLDELGEPEKSVKVYKSSIKLLPDMAMPTTTWRLLTEVWVSLTTR